MSVPRRGFCGRLLAGLIAAAAGMSSMLASAGCAVVATCTHLGCTVRVAGENQLQCPCHGSSFSATGAVLRGPVRRPLNQDAVSLTQAELIVSLAVGKG